MSAEIHPMELEQTHPLLIKLEECREWLEPSLEDGFYSWVDVVKAILTGNAMLWPGKNCAIVTEDNSYPDGTRALQTWVAGGDMEEILSLAPGIEAMARLRGCTSSLVQGRAGWSKPLKAMGYRIWSTTLRKEL